VDPRFMVDSARLDAVAQIVERHWPEEIANDELTELALIRVIEAARAQLLQALGLAALL